MLNFHCRHFQTWCTRAFDTDLGNRKSTLRSFAFICFLGHYLHFTFCGSEKKTAEKDAKAGKLVAIRTRGPDGKIWTAEAHAINQSDSRLHDSGPLRCLRK